MNLSVLCGSRLCFVVFFKKWSLLMHGQTPLVGFLHNKSEYIRKSAAGDDLYSLLSTRVVELHRHTLLLF